MPSLKGGRCNGLTLELFSRSDLLAGLKLELLALSDLDWLKFFSFSTLDVIISVCNRFAGLPLKLFSLSILVVGLTLLRPRSDLLIGLLLALASRSDLGLTLDNRSDLTSIPGLFSLVNCSAAELFRSFLGDDND